MEKSKKKVMEAVAKHMRFKIPTKSAVIKGEKVEYFSGELAEVRVGSGVSPQICLTHTWYIQVIVFMICST